MIEITQEPISPEQIVNKAKTDACGCVATYVGLIRGTSEGKPVLSVEYRDPDKNAVKGLEAIAAQIKRQWPVETVAIIHRVGKLKVGDINLVVAIGAAHRTEGFGACQLAIDLFKSRLPTSKTETYLDGTTHETIPG